jgi:hypothetical protein
MVPSLEMSLVFAAKTPGGRSSVMNPVFSLQ